MESTIDEYDTLRVHPLLSSDESSGEDYEVHNYIYHCIQHRKSIYKIIIIQDDGEDDDTEESDSDHDSSFTHPTALKQLQ